MNTFKYTSKPHFLFVNFTQLKECGQKLQKMLKWNEDKQRL